MNPRYLYAELSSLVQARLNCLSRSYDHMGRSILVPHADESKREWASKHEKAILALVKEYMPSGAGFDNGTKIDLDRSHGEKLVFTTAFNHMDEIGSYDGWTDHSVTVTGSLQGGIKLRIGGRDRNDIKEHIHETFTYALMTDLRPYQIMERFGLSLMPQWDHCTPTCKGCHIVGWQLQGTTDPTPKFETQEQAHAYIVSEYGERETEVQS